MGYAYGGLVPAIVIDPSGPRHFVSSTAYNHYSLGTGRTTRLAQERRSFRWQSS
jgi:hypothetical protein